MNIRDFATDIHHTCDDAPFGGGAGMVMKVEPIHGAMEHVRNGNARRALRPSHAPRQDLRPERLQPGLPASPHLALICGRYEGVDERVSALVDDEVSIGDYVLSGGEAAALVVIDAVARLVPGVLGNEESPSDESFHEGLLEYPQYTRPREYMGMAVPDALLSGNHEEIGGGGRKESLKRTVLRRPDLMERFQPDQEDVQLLRCVMDEMD